MTNFEKIKQLPSEKMAQLIIEISYNPCICCNERKDGEQSCEALGVNCRESIIKWLDGEFGQPKPQPAREPHSTIKRRGDDFEGLV